MHFRDLTQSKAERSCHALQSAARLAELHKKWYSAAELYEAAASIWPGNGLTYMRRAELCSSLVDSARDEMDL